MKKPTQSSLLFGLGLAAIPPAVHVALFTSGLAVDLVIAIGLIWSLPSILLPGIRYDSLRSILGYMPPSYSAAVFCFVFWFVSGFILCRLGLRWRTRKTSGPFSSNSN